ncbi:zinc finger domain-containing protein [Arthrobacter sp. TB 26]
MPAPEESHFVYRRQGLECRDCGTPVALTDLGARKLYWCPGCQKP